MNRLLYDCLEEALHPVYQHPLEGESEEKFKKNSHFLYENILQQKDRTICE